MGNLTRSERVVVMSWRYSLIFLDISFSSISKSFNYYDIVDYFLFPAIDLEIIEFKINLLQFTFFLLLKQMI